ncbi:transmembrane protein 266 [Echinops telfairi]|uniref:Transmembrane protein 266 n=1 Tax=Echinops telfairi TaxID=9371 RepID=A0AC55CQQ8_ECHTE|nr:transmembrane protein 266 [Echinops telfairi]
MTSPQPALGGGISEVEIISQQVEEETKSAAPVQLGNFAYRDLPLAAVDLSTEGSQLLSNLDEDYQREGSNWLKPCCGKRAAVWQVFLLSASLNSFLVACVILVVILLTLELLIDIKLLQFSSAFQFAGVIHWISLTILSVFFSETVLRIIVLGIWDYIENKIEVFDGAVIILSLAPMVASTVANGPRSPWDAISLIIMLRIWRLKRVIDAYVLPVKVEMEMVIQQYEKAKVIQDEQLERLTQICQEQGFEIRQLRAHLAQQDLDLAAEREMGDPRPPLRGCLSSWAPPTDAEARDDMNSYISQYYNGPSSDSGVPEPAARMVTTAAIDIHQPNISSDLLLGAVPPKPDSTCPSATSETTLNPATLLPDELAEKPIHNCTETQGNSDVIKENHLADQAAKEAAVDVQNLGVTVALIEDTAGTRHRAGYGLLNGYEKTPQPLHPGRAPWAEAVPPQEAAGRPMSQGRADAKGPGQAGHTMWTSQGACGCGALGMPLSLLHVSTSSLCRSTPDDKDHDDSAGPVFPPPQPEIPGLGQRVCERT